MFLDRNSVVHSIANVMYSNFMNWRFHFAKCSIIQRVSSVCQFFYVHWYFLCDRTYEFSAKLVL